MEHKIRRTKLMIEALEKRIKELQEGHDTATDRSEKMFYAQSKSSLLSYKSGMMFVLDILLEEG